MKNNLLDDWWQYIDVAKKLSELFEKYLIGLYLQIYHKITKKKSQGVYTGFLLDYREECLFITAGHVVDHLTEYINNPNIEIDTIKWLDGYAVEGAEGVIVHDRKNLEMMSLTDIDIDFGAIKIKGLDKGNILANKEVELMNEQGWKNLYHARPEGFYILGFPFEWQKLTESDYFKANLSILPVRMVEIYEIESLPEIVEGDFYGKILSFKDGEFQPLDIKGISGGPLLSVEWDPIGKLRYRLYGIQVSWFKRLKIIRAIVMPNIEGYLEEFCSKDFS